MFTLINFSKLEFLYANELAVGNINTKSREKVKNYPLLAKILTSQSTDPVKIRFYLKININFHTMQLVSKIEKILTNIIPHHCKTLMVCSSYLRELLAKIILNANNTGKMKTPHLSSIVFSQNFSFHLNSTCVDITVYQQVTIKQNEPLSIGSCMFN